MFYKKKKILIIFYILFFIISSIIIKFSTTKALANTYKIKDIQISQPFETNFKKTEIIDKAFDEAFKELIFKITLSSDQNKLGKINLNIIKELVDSFTITDEKFIENNYSANFEVDFQKKGVLKFLEKKNIFPSILKKKTLLILPVFFDVNENEIFFFNENKFFVNWNYKNDRHFLLNYVLPNEDLEDIKYIKKNMETIEDYNFTHIISKYDLNDYIVAILFKNKNELKCLSKIFFNNKLYILNKEFKNLNLNEKSNIAKVIEDLKIDYEDQWKKINLINTSIKLPLTLQIETKNIDLMLKFKRKLDSLDLISNHYIDKFSSEAIMYKIIYNSTPDKFITEIESSGFKIDTSTKIWKVQ